MLKHTTSLQSRIPVHVHDRNDDAILRCRSVREGPALVYPGRRHFQNADYRMSQLSSVDLRQIVLMGPLYNTSAPYRHILTVQYSELSE